MSPEGGVWAVIPVKAFAAAKARLATRYGPELRRALARAMVEDVLAALAAVGTLAGIAVVTADPEAADLAGSYQARVIADGARDGHTGAVTAAIARLSRDGAAAVLTLPGDIPTATAAEIEALLDGHGPAPAFTIVPAHDGRGSNAILMSPPDAVPLRFGDDSFVPHLAAARARGIEPRVLRLPGIALDIDAPEDVEALLQRPAVTRAHAVLRGWARSG